MAGSRRIRLDASDDAWTIVIGPKPASRIPPAPEREAFVSAEAFEEARGYWRSHYRRIQAWARQAERRRNETRSAEGGAR
jgi:hypothetical protein